MHYLLYHHFIKVSDGHNDSEVFPTFPGRLVLPPSSKLTDSPPVLSPDAFSVLNKMFCLTFAIVQRTRTVQKARFQRFLVSQSRH